MFERTTDSKKKFTHSSSRAPSPMYCFWQSKSDAPCEEFAAWAFSSFVGTHGILRLPLKDLGYICGGDWTPAHGIARMLLMAKLFSVVGVHGYCLMGTQSGVFFNISVETKQGLRKRSLQGLWHNTNPPSTELPHKVH